MKFECDIITGACLRLPFFFWSVKFISYLCELHGSLTAIIFYKRKIVIKAFFLLQIKDYKGNYNKLCKKLKYYHLIIFVTASFFRWCSKS